VARRAQVVLMLLAAASGGSRPPVSRRKGGYSSRIEQDVGDNAGGPAVEAENEVEDAARVAVGEEQAYSRDEGENLDEAPGAGPAGVVAGCSPPPAAEPPMKMPTRIACGITSSHHLTSTSPRESRPG